MTRLAIALLLLAAVPAWGQYPPSGGGFPQPPSFGSRMPQSPLSPYLNLLNGNGGNAAANYYNFTRPLLQQQGMSPFGPQQFGQSAGGFQQQIGFLPPVPLPEYATLDATDPTGKKLPPTGHPVQYGNRFSGAGMNPTQSGFAPTGQQPPRPSPPTKTIPRAKQ